MYNHPDNSGVPLARRHDRLRGLLHCAKRCSQQGGLSLSAFQPLPTVIQLLLFICPFMPTLTHQILSKVFSFPRRWARYWRCSGEQGDVAPWTRSSTCFTHNHTSTRQRDCGLGCKEEPRETCGHVTRGPKLLSPPFTVRNVFKDRDCPCVICYVMCLSYWDSSVFFTFSVTQMNGGGDQRDLCGIL